MAASVNCKFTFSPGSPGSPGSPLMVTGDAGSSGSVQTKLQPSEQHLAFPLHSLSNKHPFVVSASGGHSSAIGATGHSPGFSSKETKKLKRKHDLFFLEAPKII